MKNQLKQTPSHAFCEALQENIQGSRHAIKFMAQLVAAILKTRTSNLAQVALAIESEAEPGSVYRQVQRFLKNENKVSIDYFKLLNLKGPLKILIDRTEWKFGATWINILTVSFAYQQVAIPLVWEVVNHKGNATAREHVAIIKQLVVAVGRQRIKRVYADREFGSYELLNYLLENKIDFHIRLKSSHKSGGKSFAKMWKQVETRVKLRGKVKIEVFGLEVYVSCVKYQKEGKTEYLIVASGEYHRLVIEEYKVRWQIETMFGCLKKRGFNFEETHLTMPRKISKLLLILSLGLSLAILMGEVQVKVWKQVKMKKKKNNRYAKSMFRIGLDALQNLLFNYHKPNKLLEFQLFIQLLSCA